MASAMKASADTSSAHLEGAAGVQELGPEVEVAEGVLLRTKGQGPERRVVLRLLRHDGGGVQSGCSAWHDSAVRHKHRASLEPA